MPSVLYKHRRENERISIEEKMNDPDAVIRRGYELAKKKLEAMSLLMGISNQIDTFTQNSL